MLLSLHGEIILESILYSTYMLGSKDKFFQIAQFSSEGTENVLYLPTYVRAPAYLIGSILGYYTFITRFVPVKINTVIH